MARGIEDLGAALAVRACDKGVELICSVGPDVPVMLKGDWGRLRQVLNNLVGNAVKFTSEGEVAVRVTVLDESEAEAWIHFSVTDTGIGIPQEKMGLLFNKFTQVDSSTSRKYGGSGLGLAISKCLVELMGGEMGVKSTIGQGSEFWFSIPFKKQKATPQTEYSLSDYLTGVRVLVVDDNATSLEMITTRLKSWGMRPQAALGGIEALETLRRGVQEKDMFPLALIDQYMPGMDGEKLGRAIKADKSLVETRMVMLTRLGDRRGASSFEEIGFSAHTSKPLRMQDLRASLSLALKSDNQKISIHSQTHKEWELAPVFDYCGTRILVADDIVVNQQVVTGLLKKLGLRVDTVENGLDVLKALAITPYDLVLMDVQMPDMDGLEATRRIRNPATGLPNPNIPIIALTAHSLTGDSDDCLRAGMNDYLTKPLLPSALIKALKKWLPPDSKNASANVVVKGTTKICPAAPGAETEATSIMVFNAANLLERSLNDQDFAKVIINLFLTESPQELRMLKESINKKDLKRAQMQAHKIKGMAANVGGETLREKASEMEKAGMAGDLAALRAAETELLEHFAMLTESLGKFMQEAQSVTC